MEKLILTVSSVPLSSKSHWSVACMVVSVKEEMVAEVGSSPSKVRVMVFPLNDQVPFTVSATNGSQLMTRYSSKVPPDMNLM